MVAICLGVFAACQMAGTSDNPSTIPSHTSSPSIIDVTDTPKATITTPMPTIIPSPFPILSTVEQEEVVFVRFPRPNEIMLAADPLPLYAIYSDGSNERLLFTYNKIAFAEFPQVSPDGQFMALMDGPEAIMINLQTRERIILDRVSDTGNEQFDSFVWHPDSQGVYYVRTSNLGVHGFEQVLMYAVAPFKQPPQVISNDFWVDIDEGDPLVIHPSFVLPNGTMVIQEVNSRSGLYNLATDTLQMFTYMERFIHILDINKNQEPYLVLFSLAQPREGLYQAQLREDGQLTSIQQIDSVRYISATYITDERIVGSVSSEGLCSESEEGVVRCEQGPLQVRLPLENRTFDTPISSNIAVLDEHTLVITRLVDDVNTLWLLSLETGDLNYLTDGAIPMVVGR
jgi:hypothetical protein